MPKMFTSTLGAIVVAVLTWGVSPVAAQQLPQLRLDLNQRCVLVTTVETWALSPGNGGGLPAGMVGEGKARVLCDPPQLAGLQQSTPTSPTVQPSVFQGEGGFRPAVNGGGLSSTFALF